MKTKNHYFYFTEDKFKIKYIIYVIFLKKIVHFLVIRFVVYYEYDCRYVMFIRLILLYMFDDWL